ncbi:MAG: alpha/beta hydrolase [Actinomycetota bacterium]|nr:alpha/beta hydrolase [Actinomycetota bacterium]
MPYVGAGDIRIHYEEKGRGPEAILFVHGNIASWRWWEEVMDLLPEEEYHAYAPDSRGCGLTDKPDRGHSIEQFAEDVEAFADALNLKKFTLVGHSLGGATALRYATRYPRRLERLVLLDPPPAQGVKIARYGRPLFRHWQRDKRALGRALKGTAPTRAYDPFFEKLVDEAFEAGGQVFEGNARALAQMDVSGELGRIEVPTLLIAGGMSGWSSLRGIRKMHRAIPNGRLKIVPDAGHSLNVEDPRKFADLLTGFCRATSRPEAIR